MASPWTEIAKMVKASNNFKNTDLELSGDFIIYKKILNFLLLGATGTLYEIDHALGRDQLECFLGFVINYIDKVNTPGHFYPPKSVQQDLKAIELGKDLFNLNKTLDQINSVEYEKHGVKNIGNWRKEKVVIKSGR